jgi:hypothetical protein
VAIAVVMLFGIERLVVIVQYPLNAGLIVFICRRHFSLLRGSTN